MSLSAYYHYPSVASLWLLGVTTLGISSPPSLTFLRFLRRRRYFSGESFRAMTLCSCSSSWTTPRPTTFSGLHLRPPTPSSTIALAFPFAASLPMVSFDLSWKGEGNLEFFPSLGFYCRCCYPGHSHSSDTRINPDITHRLTRSNALFTWHAYLEAARPPADTSWLESASPASFNTTWYVRVDSLVMPSPATSTMLCGIGLTRGTSVALLPVKFNMLVCSFVQTSSPLMASDVLTFLYDFFIHMYYILLAALRQLVAIFCQRSSLPKRTRKELYFHLLLSLVLVVFPSLSQTCNLVCLISPFC